MLSLKRPQPNYRCVQIGYQNNKLMLQWTTGLGSICLKTTHKSVPYVSVSATLRTIYYGSGCSITVALKIGSSLINGFSRVANRNGAILAFAYVGLGLIWQVAFYSAFVTWLQRANPEMTDVALPTVDVPLAISALVAIVALLLLQVAAIVSIRTFVGGHTDEIPSEYYTRNIVPVLANALVGSFAYGLLVFVGSLLLIIPGIIAYVAFLFMLVYIAVEDENFLAALRDSWALTRGNWLLLFGLLVIVFVGLSLIPGILAALVSFVIGAYAGPAMSTLVSGAITVPFSLFVLGILAEAFIQLRGDEVPSEL